MPKKTTETPAAAGSQSSSIAIKQTEYDKLVGKVANANSTMDTARERKSELIADAVENNNLHKTAFAWVMKLRKMDPVKRNELLFHFEVMCDYEKFAREDLLDDRAAESGDEGEPDEAKDLRPRHLRQPNASAAADHVRDLATKAGAKPASGDDAIDKVGRGKPN